MKATTIRATVSRFLPSLLASALLVAAGGRHLIKKISIPGRFHVNSWDLHQLCDKVLHYVWRNTQIAVSQRATLVQNRLALLERWAVGTLKESADWNHISP